MGLQWRHSACPPARTSDTLWSSRTRDSATPETKARVISLFIRPSPEPLLDQRELNLTKDRHVPTRDAAASPEQLVAEMAMRDRTEGAGHRDSVPARVWETFREHSYQRAQLISHPSLHPRSPQNLLRTRRYFRTQGQAAMMSESVWVFQAPAFLVCSLAGREKLASVSNSRTHP